jgi:hypothetical protein
MMNIHLNEPELKEAIERFIESQGFDLTNRAVTISLTAGRSGRGHYADITLTRDDIAEEDPFAESAVVETVEPDNVAEFTAEATTVESDENSDDYTANDDDQNALDALFG